MTEIYKISIEDCKQGSTRLFEEISSTIGLENVKGLVAVLNAGMFPAYWLRKLIRKAGQDCPLHTIDVRSYHANRQQGEMHITQKPDIDADGKGWVFVDEISDTGNTFNALREIYPQAHFVALVAKPKGKSCCDIAVMDVAQDQWAEFPWEIEEE